MYCVRVTVVVFFWSMVLHGLSDSQSTFAKPPASEPVHSERNSLQNMEQLLVRPGKGGGPPPALRPSLARLDGKEPARILGQPSQYRSGSRLQNGTATTSAHAGPAFEDGLAFLATRIGETTNGWETVFFDDFEGTWPGPWYVFDYDSASGRDSWGPVSCKPGGALSGSNAAWCAADGDQAACGPSYDNDMWSWMDFGPFTLRNAIEAEVQLYFVNESELDYDSVRFLLSINGWEYSGVRHSGTTPGYPDAWHHVTLDLSDVPLLGSLIGQPHVWFAAVFASDFTNEVFGGAYVDDVTILRNVVDECAAAPGTPAEGAEICFPQTFTLTPSGNCWDMRIAFTADPGNPLVMSDPSGPLVFTVFVEGTSRTLEQLDWEWINTVIGGSDVYHWTVGDQIDEFFYPTAPWRPFTVCLPCPATGDCCTPHATGGCDHETCCRTVCALDPSCCNNQWDELCTIEAADECGCDRCGNGVCSFDEDCSTCALDCGYTGSSDDCNLNDIPDGCDTQIGGSRDCNNDGIPDECLGTECPLQDGDAFTTSYDRLLTVDLATGDTSHLTTFTGCKGVSGATFDPTDGSLVVVEYEKVLARDLLDLSSVWWGYHGLTIWGAGLAADGLGNFFLLHDQTIYSVDKPSGVATELATIVSMDHGDALAFSPDGTLYAVGEMDSLNGVDGLVKLNPTTGELIEVIGALGPGGDWGSSGMDFDSRGNLYLVSGSERLLWMVSTVDATATTLVGAVVPTYGSLAIFRDCDENGTHDAHDVASGAVPDIDGNGIPDGCPFCGDAMCDGPENPCNCETDCGAPTASEGPDLTCTDGEDNDCDLDIDCDDADCADDPACAPPPAPGGPGDLIFTTSNLTRRHDGVTGQFLHEFHASHDILASARGLAIGPDGHLYVAGCSTRNVVRFDLRTGLLLDTFVEPESGGLSCAWGLTFGPDGNLYVTEYSASRVYRFDGVTGAFMDIFVSAGSGGLNGASDLAFGPDGSLYVGSVETDSILRFDGQDGSFVDVFVVPNSGGLYEPRGLLFCDDGMLYVTSSTFQAAILRYDSTTGAFVDEFVPPGSGGLRFPYGLAFGPDGNLYVSQEGGALVRFDGMTGEFLGAFVNYASRYLVFQPAECQDDADCDDMLPETTDVCHTYACYHMLFTRLYVDRRAVGAQDGMSWATAFRDLQDALDLAATVDGPLEIWVARGTYTPDRDTGDRYSTFHLPDDVFVYGGFAGSESLLEERNPTDNVTILSGDLNDDDGPDFENNHENSYHVVTASDCGVDAPTVLDGFMVTGGNADGPDYEPGEPDAGGGLFVYRGAPTIRNCTFLANGGTYGGGVHCKWATRPTFLNCAFIGNVTSSAGGGMSLDDTNARLVNCIFSGNESVLGGAVASGGSYPTFTNCTITGNSALNRGGISNEGGPIITLTNCILWNNVDSGGTDQSAQLGGSNWNINYCCIQGWTGDLGGTGNTADCGDSLYSAPGADGTAGTKDDDLHLRYGTPPVDSGTNDADTDANVGGIQPLPDVDFGGGPRIRDGVVDLGAYEAFPDCNLNGVEDDIDVENDPSLDSDGDGMLDACCVDPISVQVGTVPATNRYLSFSQSEPGYSQAVRVTMADLPVPYDGWEDLKMWAQEPTTYCENAGKTTPPCPDAQPSTEFHGATLGCDPYWTDWSTFDVVHIYHEGIVPDGTYELQTINEGCRAEFEHNYSAPVAVAGSIWGDAVKDCTTCPCGPPDGVVGIPTDVTAVLEKFKNLVPPSIPCPAIIKVRADLEPQIPDQLVNISDVTFCLDAFRGFGYPPESFPPPSPPPCGGVASGQ